MSRPYAYLAERVFGTPLMIHGDKLETILGVVGPRFGADAPRADFFEPDDEEDDPEEEVSEDDEDMANICVIPVTGSLVKRGGMNAMSGMTSYRGLREQMAAANAAGKGIILDMDTPGGEASGVFEFADFIKNCTVPVYAACGNVYSAGIAIAASCDRVYVSSDGEMGSIGVIAVHRDQSAAEKMAGLKYSLIYAGSQKADLSPHRPLSTEAEKRLQARVDDMYGMLVSLVADGRPVSEDVIRGTQAGCFNATEAINLGLADQVGTLQDAIADMATALKSVEQVGPDGAQAMSMMFPDGVPRKRVEWRASAEPVPATADDAELPVVSSATLDRLLADARGGWPAGTRASRLRLLQQANPALVFPTETPIYALATSPADVGKPTREVKGCVAPYSKVSEVLGAGFREMYAPGCFADAIEKRDIRALAHHDDSKVLGCTSAGTLKLIDTPYGLDYSIDMPDATYANDALASIQRSDIRGSSTRFYLQPNGFHFETIGGERVRVITAADLIEVSLVTFPAYTTTTAKVGAPAGTDSVQPSGPADAKAFDDGYLATLRKQIDLAGLR